MYVHGDQWMHSSVFDDYDFIRPDFWDREAMLQQWCDTGCVILEEFAGPLAWTAMLGDLNTAMPYMHMAEVPDTLERDGTDAFEGRGGPASEFTSGYVARDQLAPHTVIKRLFSDSLFKAALAEVTGNDEIYEYADPLAGVVGGITAPGGIVDWHYDASDVTASILLQPSEEGGYFEYEIPGTDDKKVFPLQRGALQLFDGRNIRHRVQRTGGTVRRMTVLLAYCKEPGVVSMPAEQVHKMYGRTTEMHDLVDRYGAVMVKPSAERE